MPRPSRPLPSECVEDWPAIASDDPAVEVARCFALALRDAMGGRSTRAVRDVTGVDHSTVADVLSGRVWPDAHTIARLEAGLQVNLWPHGVARRVAADAGTPSPNQLG